jgi:predicted transcriptional regulator
LDICSSIAFVTSLFQNLSLYLNHGHQNSTGGSGSFSSHQEDEVPGIIIRMKRSGKRAGEKKRTEVLLPRELVERIDALAGERGRTRFIEEALRRELRRRAWEEWLAFGEKLRGLTLEDTLYAARSEVEKRGY